MSATVVPISAMVSLNEVPAALRELAAGIERGEYGKAFACAYVIDTGDGFVEVGLAGKSASAGAEAHLLLSIGMRKLENLTRPDVIKEAG